MDFPFSTFTSTYIYLKSRYLHTVKGIVFNAGNHILFLYSLHQGRPHVPDMERVFSKNLLAPSPAGVIRNIYTNSTKKIATISSDLPGYSPPNSFLKLCIKTRSPGQWYRKTGAATGNHSPSSITKSQLRYSQLLISSSRVGFIIKMLPISDVIFYLLQTHPAAHQIDLFFQRHPGNNHSGFLSI